MFHLNYLLYWLNPTLHGLVLGIYHAFKRYHRKTASFALIMFVLQVKDCKMCLFVCFSSGLCVSRYLNPVYCKELQFIMSCISPYLITVYCIQYTPVEG